MKTPSYHTHTELCDGKAPAEEYIKAAIEKEIPAIGFTGHAPVPFQSWWNMTNEDYKFYLKEIERLKLKYSDKIIVHKGIEADYIKDVTGIDKFVNDKLDYIIGAIHYLHIKKENVNWDFIISPKIFSKGIEIYFGNDIKIIVKKYYEAINNMLDDNPPDIIAHIDQINKFNKGNKYFSPQDDFHKKAINETLQLAKEKGTIIEINTRTVYRGLTEDFNPSFSIIKTMKSMNIPIIFSADVHKTSETGLFIKEAIAKAKAAGYNSHAVYTEGSFSEVELL